MNQCMGITLGGARCRANALPGKTLCFSHDPESRARADDARRKGGHNSSNLARAAKAMPRDMKGLAARILEAFEEAYTGTLAPDRAHAMARLAAVYVRVHEVGEIEQRLAELEERAAQPQRRAMG